MSLSKIEQAQQEVAVISPDIVEIEPIDPDEDFSDIYLGVKDEFVEGKCKMMALKGEDPSQQDVISKTVEVV